MKILFLLRKTQVPQRCTLKMTALKWPRPGGFHIHDAILARRHSHFSHFFGKISDGKPSILRFFLQKTVTARNWRRPEAGAFGMPFWRVVASSKSHHALGDS